MEGTPQFVGRVKRHTLAARDRFHDAGHAGRIAPVYPDYVDTQFFHDPRSLSTWEQVSKEPGTDRLQIGEKEKPKAGKTGKYPFGRTNVLGEEVRQQLFQNGKFELDDIPDNFVVNAIVTVDESIPQGYDSP